MHRRSFLFAAFAGTAAAGLGTMSAAQAASAIAQLETPALAHVEADLTGDIAVDAEYARHMTWAGHGRRRRSSRRRMMRRRKPFNRTRRARPNKQGS